VPARTARVSRANFEKSGFFRVVLLFIPLF
jgi:hypothetical protein